MVLESNPARYSPVSVAVGEAAEGCAVSEGFGRSSSASPHAAAKARTPRSPDSVNRNTAPSPDRAFYNNAIHPLEFARPCRTMPSAPSQPVPVAEGLHLSAPGGALQHEGAPFAIEFARPRSCLSRNQPSPLREAAKSYPAAAQKRKISRSPINLQIRIHKPNQASTLFPAPHQIPLPRDDNPACRPVPLAPGSSPLRPLHPPLFTLHSPLTTHHSPPLPGSPPASLPTPARA